MLSLTVLVSALGSGCVANDVSLSIDKFIPRETDCSLKSDTDLVKLGGIYDVYLGTLTQIPYEVSFTVGNNLPTRDNIPIDTQAYYINSYDVELDINSADPAAAAVPGSSRKFNSPAGSVRLTPGSTTPGKVFIRPELFAALATDFTLPSSLVNVRIRPVATRAEEEVVGAFSSFPLTVCTGCLTGLPPATAGAARTIAACPLPAGSAVLPGNKCSWPSDVAITCCKETTGTVICGSSVPVAMATP